MNSESLLELIRGKDIYIYGAGYVAKKFYHAIRQQPIHIVAFITSHKVEDEIDGIRVVDVEQVCFDQKQIVCIAVHESIRDEIINQLNHADCKNYIWVYPFLFELCYGSPERGRRIEVGELVRSYPDPYQLAVRWMVIEQYQGKREDGDNCYRKLFEKHVSPNTAQKRLDQYKRLIRSWDEDGYNEESHIAVNRNHEVIDGVHRLALAAYYKMKDVICDIYPTDLPARKIHQQIYVHDKKELKELGFSDREISAMDRIIDKHLNDREMIKEGQITLNTDVLEQDIQRLFSTLFAPIIENFELDWKSFEKKNKNDIEMSRDLGRNGWVISPRINPRIITDWYNLKKQKRTDDIQDFFLNEEENVIKEIFANLTDIYEGCVYEKLISRAVEHYDKYDYLSTAIFLSILFNSRIDCEIRPEGFKHDERYSTYGFRKHLNERYKQNRNSISRDYFFRFFYPSIIAFSKRFLSDGGFPMSSGNEPPYLNRNWLLHGRGELEVNQKECIQLINAMDALEFVLQGMSPSNTSFK